MKHLHFIAGLPRSGSTLLTAILNQNPRFTAGMADPLIGIIQDIYSQMSTDTGVFTDDQILEFVKDVVNIFYKNSNAVCFNNHRAWTANTALAKKLYPKSKMILCVRDVPWILDSFEKLNAKNPMIQKPLYGNTLLSNVYDRCRFLMDETKFVGGPLNHLAQALYSDDTDMICVVDYNALAKSPLTTMQQIYKFIDEPWFQHDFDNVAVSYDDYDSRAKIIGLHTTRKVIDFQERNSLLPPNIWNAYNSSSFWKHDLNIKNRVMWIE
jgi:sulfotransferase